jgi:hypothetical protein
MELKALPMLKKNIPLDSIVKCTSFTEKKIKTIKMIREYFNVLPSFWKPQGNNYKKNRKQL